MKSNAQYKQTEIGEIPEEWNVLAVEEFAEVIGGGTPSTKDSSYFGGDIPWITPKDLSTWTNKRISRGERSITEKGLNTSGLKLLPKNSVLLTSRAPVGYLAIADNAVATNQGFKSLIPKENADSDFVYYLLKSNVDKLKNNASGSTFQELSGGVLKKIKFALPELPEQQQIASILSSLDDKIELNRRMNKTLEEIGKALFKRWFVDFEFPNENGEPYKSSGGEMVESELGEMPKGWQIKSLDQIAEYLNGVACQKYPPLNDIDSLPVIKIAELKGGFSENSNRASSKVDEKYHIKSGDVLFSWSGSLEVCLWPYGEGILNQHLFKVSSEYYPKWFYYFWTLEHLSHFRIIAASKATTMGHIQRKHLSDALTVVPTEDILIRLSPIIDKILEKIIVNNKEIMNLSNVRDSILPRLMSGKIRV